MRPDFCATIPFLQRSRSERNDEISEPLTAKAMAIVTTNVYGIKAAAAGGFDVRLFARGRVQSAVECRGCRAVEAVEAVERCRAL